MRFHLPTIVLGLLASTPAWASPWAEVGDNALRADIALLATSGAVNDVTSQWSLPWAGLLPDIQDARLETQSPDVRAAAGRVLRRGRAETQPGLSGKLSFGAATTPSLVYCFDGLGRGEGQAQVSLS
jgi:hypothetical protein